MSDILKLAIGFAAVCVFLAVPFLVGKHIESARGGLIGLSIVPVAVGILGIFAYVNDAHSSNAETRAWAGIVLIIPVFAGIVEVVGVVVWAFGRVLRHEDDEREARPLRDKDHLFGPIA